MKKNDPRWFLYEEASYDLSLLTQLRAIRAVLRHMSGLEAMTPEMRELKPAKAELLQILLALEADQGVGG